MASPKESTRRPRNFNQQEAIGEAVSEPTKVDRSPDETACLHANSEEEEVSQEAGAAPAIDDRLLVSHSSSFHHGQEAEETSKETTAAKDASDKRNDWHEVDQPFIYCDYSQAFDGRRVGADVPSLDSTVRFRKLPAKLNAILDDETIQHIISWLPHGRAWKVHDSYLFVQQVMPKYFDNANFNSWIRLINAWGFRRLSKGIDRNAYYHELFLRGLPHLHIRMRRLTPNEKKVPMDPENEPDFSRMCLLPPKSSGNSPLLGDDSILATLAPRPPMSVATYMGAMLNQQGMSGFGGINSSLPRRGPTFEILGSAGHPGGHGFRSNSSGGNIENNTHFFTAAAGIRGQNTASLSPLLGGISNYIVQQAELAESRRRMELEVEHIRAQARRLDAASSLGNIPTPEALRQLEIAALLGSVPSSSLNSFGSSLRRFVASQAQWQDALNLHQRLHAARQLASALEGRDRQQQAPQDGHTPNLYSRQREANR